MKVFKSSNLYKLIVFIFLTVAIIKLRGQLVTIQAYDKEIATLNEKISELEEQENNNDSTNVESRENNEDIARKDLKMYYPNETPYKGY